MLKIIVNLLLLDLFYVTLQVSGLQENTFVSNSSIIRCAENTTIKIVDLNVEQLTTPCSEYKQCNLTEKQTDAIKNRCNKEMTCTITTIIPDSCLFNDYGHVSVSYSCTVIVNSSCTFENDNCGWSYSGDDKYQWTIGRGETSISSTGPYRDHTTASAYGYYVYTKSKRWSNFNDVSYLQSGIIVSSPKQCLTFWYHMYGRDINTLQVFQLNSEHNIELWSKSHNQGNKWHLQSLSLNDIGPYRIMFKATRGNGRKSEIAVDDIFITNTVCKKASILDCNFEKETCEWSVEMKSDYTWTIISGDTRTEDTGPKVDHTYGFHTGHYVYLEASSIQPGQTSNYTSVTVSPDGEACFTFWFHMYGDGIGTLNVYLVSEKIKQKLWSRSGNKPDVWQLAFVDIAISEPYQITLEGVRGSNNEGDIAVDDIALLPGSCNQKGLIKTSLSCHNIDESISLHECSKYYLKLNETSLVFDHRKFDNCSVVYQDVQTSITTVCNDMINSDICTFYIPESIMKDQRCFQSNRLSVEYRCEAMEMSTVSSVISSTKGSSEGLVVGLVIGGLLLACVVILIVVLVRRHTVKSKPREKIRNNLGGNDYIGSEDIALPQTTNQSSHMLKTAETSFNGTTDDGTRTTDSYMVSDPSVTGINRTKLSNTSAGYELAKPVKDTGVKIDVEDQCVLSEEGVYDHSGNNSHKELEDNIYNHAVDTIYDSGSHKRIDEGKEDTYDHFFGQKTEDDYDISTTT